MSRRGLSNEEEALVDSIFKRKIRLIVLAEKHTDVVRREGRQVLVQAHHEASEALAAKTGHEVVYPLRGTDMEEYYKIFEPALTANAQTPYEHMYIALVATGLIAVVNTCEYAYLSEQAKQEVDVKMENTTRELFNPTDRDAITGRHLPVVQQLPILSPVSLGTQLVKLTHQQVHDYLANFSNLHHKILLDSNSCECYKIIGVNYSPATPSVESYEVLLQGCTSAVEYSFDDVKQMLFRSSAIVE